GQSPEQPDQPKEREQNSDGGQSLTGQVEEPTPEVMQGHTELPDQSRGARRHSSNGARISTTNKSRNRTSHRYMRDDRYIALVASVNSLASVEAMVQPGSNSATDRRWALPITKVTVMVSPSARHSLSMKLPTMPMRVNGMITPVIISQRVAPMPWLASLRLAGTLSNRSTSTDAMNGITMIARTRPAVNTPMPMGGPWKSAPMSGQSPRWPVNQGWTPLASQGESTNNPQ